MNEKVYQNSDTVLRRGLTRAEPYISTNPLDCEALCGSPLERTVKITHWLTNVNMSRRALCVYVCVCSEKRRSLV